MSQRNLNRSWGLAGDGRLLVLIHFPEGLLELGVHVEGVTFLVKGFILNLVTRLSL